jgi:hypothetical protein
MSFNYPPSPSPQSRRQTDLRLDSPLQLAIVAGIAWLVGVVIHPLAILVPLGIVLLVLAGVAYLLRPKTQTMYWRGRRIDLNDQGSGAAQRLYRQVFKH